MNSLKPLKTYGDMVYLTVYRMVKQTPGAPFTNMD